MDCDWRVVAEYTVNVATAGNYNVDVRAASMLAGGTFHIEFNGVDKPDCLRLSTQTVGKTGRQSQKPTSH